MKPTLFGLLLILSAVAPSVAQEEPTTPSTVVKSDHDRAKDAFQTLVNAVEEGNWREAKAVETQLKTLGDDAFRLLENAAKRHENEKIRERSYRLLIDAFPDRQRTWHVVATDGLRDDHARIQYLCAFQLGEHKMYKAHRYLRVVLQRNDVSDQLRFTAAKSLAELGEPDVIRVLYDGLGHDSINVRRLSNIGIKALTGRDLSEYGYDYLEGGMLSGGAEYHFSGNPIGAAQHRADRFTAIALFCRWLKIERPDIFKHLTAGV